jgi:hypothetical protein
MIQKFLQHPIVVLTPIILAMGVGRFDYEDARMNECCDADVCIGGGK